MATRSASPPDEIENIDHRAEDNTEICFQQGKPCVFMAPDAPPRIITKWPNGVTDTRDIATNTIVRQWPDGTSEKLAEDWGFPHWPRRREAAGA